jgi:hypothetical protein
MTDVPPSSAPAERDLSTKLWSRQTAAAMSSLAVVVVLADMLFYLHEPGISLAIFFFALIAGVAALHPQRWRDRRVLTLGIVAALAALPFIESENLFWTPFALGAVALFALDAARLLPKYEDWFGTVTRFAVLSPVRGMVDAIQLLGEAGQQKLGGRLVRVGLVWVVPAVCAAVFAWLFVAANPVLDELFRMLRLESLWRLLDPLRVFIWGLVAAVTWPLLMPRLLPWSAMGQWQGPLRPEADGLLFGAAAIRNSLIVFNAIFAVQTLMDLAYLWGGVRLPDDLTYADYAHRGAYPLIITAVLAGAFVLAAMRRDGPARNSPLLRGLVYLWVGQNVWLVISSILRLKLYVEAYGLSEMRIAAGIWMGLVASGLLLIVAKIAWDKSNRWLVMANSTALMLTLWATAFLNFPAAIATFNVAHSLEVTGQGMALDDTYMSELGPQVIPALDTFLRTAPRLSAETRKAVELTRDNLAEPLIDSDLLGKAELHPVDWQSWTWRDDRLRRYLKAQPFAPDAAAAMN